MKANFLIIIVVLISLNITSLGQEKKNKPINEHSSPVQWTGCNTGNPNDNNSTISQPKISDRVNELLTEQRNAKLSGNGNKCEEIQQMIDRENPGMSSSIKLTPCSGGGKYIGEKLPGSNSVFASVIFNNHYAMQSTAVYTEQIGKNAGRVWVFVQTGSDFLNGPDTIRAFYTDNNGANWTYHSLYWLQGTDKIGVDGMDVEIIENTSGDKYIWLTYTELNYSNGWEEIFPGLLIIREPGIFQSAMYTLTWPGDSHSNPSISNYNPRITSDNATYQSGASYVYIAASSDSSTTSGNYQFQKIAFCTNPYTISPTITYRGPQIFWYCNNSGWTNPIHTDIQYFGSSSGIINHDSLIVVMSDVKCNSSFVFTSKFDEHPDIHNPVKGPTLDLGYPFNDKDYARIAGNGGTDMMIVVRDNYNDNGDWDIMSAHSTDGGNSWINAYIDSRSDNVNVPHQPEIFGKKDRTKTGNYKVAYYVGSNQTGSYDSIYTSYYPAPTYNNWSNFSAVNSINANGYASVAKPSFMNNPNDSCYIVWIANSGGLYGSLGCEGHISGMGPVHVNNVTDNSIPADYRLDQNYPNPFNPTTSINYELPVTGNVKLVVYDVLGKETAVLVNERQNAGKYSVSWDATNYASGIYFYKIETDNFTDIKKMILVK